MIQDSRSWESPCLVMGHAHRIRPQDAPRVRPRSGQLVNCGILCACHRSEIKFNGCGDTDVSHSYC